MADQAVLFDCDGVLVDSEHLSLGLLRDDLEEYGLALTLDEVADIFMGGTLYSDVEKARALGAALPQDWVARFYEKMFDLLRRKVEPVVGAPELVAHLDQRGVKMAVASNGPIAKMEITLSRTGLIEMFRPHLYSAHDLPNPKPAPDVYLHAAQALGVSPEQCIVVEDSATGARAAQAAKMRCIGVAADGQGDHLRPYCYAVVRDMTEVLGHLQH